MSRRDPAEGNAVIGCVLVMAGAIAVTLILFILAAAYWLVQTAHADPGVASDERLVTSHQALSTGHGPLCEPYQITGYVRGAHSPWTYDGTSVWTREPIAAASWNVPLGAEVEVDGLGRFRVADRGGGLGPRHIDILVDTVAQAHALTGERLVCVRALPEDGYS
jgi:3D (Asp-Asp-Asp) domain-containing protein